MYIGRQATRLISTAGQTDQADVGVRSSMAGQKDQAHVGTMEKKLSSAVKGFSFGVS